LIKLLHTADVHFGSDTYGRIDPETGLNTRLRDFRRSFDFMVEQALAEDIDLFLFAGDAYRTADPTPTQQKMFAEGLRPLAERGIPIVMIVGNHDHPVSFGKASALDIFPYLQGHVQVFRTPDWRVIPTKSGPLQLLALPWPIRSTLLSREEHRRRSPAEIRTFIEEKYVQFLDAMLCDEGFDPALPTVLAAHLTVQGAEAAGSERTSLIEHEPKFTVGQLARPGIDYVALGHIHKHQDRNDSHTPPVVYCGSIERITFKEWNERKGFVLVEIDTTNGQKQTRYRFVETPARPFLAFDIDARQSPDPTETILQTLAAQDVRDAVVRVRYQIDEHQREQIDTARIRETLREAYAVAELVREVDPAERQRRTIVTRESTLEEAMRNYIAQHDDLASITDQLVAAALELEAEVLSHRREEA
jgi:exonuclease SbcD